MVGILLVPVLAEAVSLIYSGGGNVVSDGIGGGGEPHFQ